MLSQTNIIGVLCFVFYTFLRSGPNVIILKTVNLILSLVEGWLCHGLNMFCPSKAQESQGFYADLASMTSDCGLELKHTQRLLCMKTRRKKY